MIDIFIVDFELRIYPTAVPQSEWENESHFIVEIGDQRIIAHKGSWKWPIIYAAFETRREAKDFKTSQETIEHNLILIAW